MSIEEELRRSLNAVHAQRIMRLADEIRSGEVVLDPTLCESIRRLNAEVSRKGREWGLGVRQYHEQAKRQGGL